jgi:RNA polymerase sigma factor (sigma-70 family)
MTLDRYLSRHYDDLLQAAQRIAGRDGPDLLHEVILQLYQTKQETIDGLLERGQMKYWVLRVMVNNYNSKTSRYHYKWRKDAERRRKFARHIVEWWDGEGIAAHRDELLTHIVEWWDGEGIAAHRDELLTHIEERLSELPWFDAEVFAIYFEDGHTLDSFSDATGISRHKLYTTIRRVRKELQGPRRQDRELHKEDGNR